MPASLVELSDLTPEGLDHWRTLSERAVEPNVFFEPDFVRSAASLFDAETALLVVTRGSEWEAAMPVFRGRGWHRVPMRFVSNWANLYCFLGTPLVGAADAESAIAELIASARGLAPVVGFDLMGGGGPVHAAIEAAVEAGGLASTSYREFERAAVHRDDDGEHVTLRPKRRRELERQRRRLAEELGDELTCTDRAGKRAAVDEFMRIEAAGWKGQQGTAMASNPAHAEFFHAVCARFAARGRLQLLALEAGPRTIAMKCNLRAGRGLFCFKIAFDESLARFSPGIQLELENVERFERDAELEWMDSCAVPGNQMINRLWAGRRPIISLGISGRGTSGIVARAGVAAARRLRRARGMDR